MQIGNQPANPEDGTLKPGEGEPDNKVPEDNNDNPPKEPKQPENPENTEEGKEPTEEPEEPEGPDYKKKFGESTKENQIVAAKAKEFESRIKDLTNINEPTDEELKVEFPNFDDMSDNERLLAKEVIKSRRMAGNATNLVLDMVKSDRERSELKDVYSKYPDLASRAEQFEAYRNKPSHKGAPIEVLAKAFLQDFKEEIDEAKPKKPKEKPKPGLEPGSGGGQPPAPATISDEEAAKIRKTDPKRYAELIKKGLI